MPFTLIFKIYLIVAGVFFLSNMSLADLNETTNDWKGYNGAFCKGANNLVDVRVSSSGISNWENTSTLIYCPVDRDIAKGGANTVVAAISLFNNNSQSGGYCTLLSRDRDNTYTIDSDQEFWPAGYGEHTVSLGPVDTNNWGNNIIYCRVPGAEGSRKTVIRSVRIDEQN